MTVPRTPTARALAAATALACLSSLAGLGGPAEAATATTACTPSKVSYSVERARAEITVTHAMKARVRANEKRTFTDPVPAVRVLTSRFERADATDGVAAHRLAQKAARKAKSDPDLTLAKPSARTEQGPLDDGAITFRASPKAVRYVLWHGVRVWSGSWSRTECGPTGNTSGTFLDSWRSFEPISYSGAFNCDKPTTSSLLRAAQKQACAIYR